MKDLDPSLLEYYKEEFKKMLRERKDRKKQDLKLRIKKIITKVTCPICQIENLGNATHCRDCGAALNYSLEESLTDKSF